MLGRMATPFQTYTVHYQSSAGSEAFIQLFNSGTFVGQITFHKDGTPVPGNVQTASGIHFLNYSLSRFADVLQILQYEGPLTVIIDRATGSGKLVTSFEPVGEQEGV
jgi:hypothetical protein